MVRLMVRLMRSRTLLGKESVKVAFYMRCRANTVARVMSGDHSWVRTQWNDIIGYRLDGFIESDCLERKAREWRQTQKQPAVQIAIYQEAAQDYGARCRGGGVQPLVGPAV